MFRKVEKLRRISKRGKEVDLAKTRLRGLKASLPVPLGTDIGSDPSAGFVSALN